MDVYGAEDTEVKNFISFEEKKSLQNENNGKLLNCSIQFNGNFLKFLR